MTLYAVIGHDHPPHSMPLRDSVRPEHRAYVRTNDQAIVLASALNDAEGNQCGSLFLIEADSPEEIRAWFAKEPFYANGVYADFKIIECRVAVNRLDKNEWAFQALGVEKAG